MNRLDQIAQQIENNSQPPVDKWKPEHVGEIDIRIDSQGHWFHEGEQIKRDQLVRLFAGILWAENGKHFLVTPVEQLSIVVEDVPYLIHQMEFVGDAWVAVTNTHEQVIVGENNPVCLRQYKEQWLPYINVRYDLWARLNRSTYYHWVEAALEQQHESDQPLELVSAGYRFEVGRLR